MAKPYETNPGEQEALRQLLLDVMAGRQGDGHAEDLGDFGQVLARTISPNRRAFSRQYIWRLKTGRDAITPEIAAALEVLAAMLDGASEVQARAHTYNVLSVYPLPPNTIVLAKPRQCAWAGCRISFVPSSPSQRYCPDCAPIARKARAKARRSGHGRGGVAVKKA